MNDYMRTVWGWYLKRSPWIKWALFLFVIIAIMILGIFSFFYAGKSSPTIFGGPDPEKEIKEVLERKFDENLKETTRMDSELARRILEKEEKRKEIEIKKKRIFEEAKKVHEDIDDSADFSDVDNAIEEYIERAIKHRKRNS